MSNEADCRALAAAARKAAREHPDCRISMLQNAQEWDRIADRSARGDFAPQRPSKED
jgi:hypothetical protein